VVYDFLEIFCLFGPSKRDYNLKVLSIKTEGNKIICGGCHWYTGMGTYKAITTTITIFTGRHNKEIRRERCTSL